ncbi:hypothetical protein J2045_001597 [Peteryoungia aggregata LMG 23059]|uniref:Uncharacterized protein n=1 Tax=Peteryoungia aggregata LMG 23059 TaxID=1368425 RepID=A0ABU0G5F5_9HYPH|nr:hypothetical protein [Peteryoungia aggregata]MDQ0420573.1 hypothetical protein [Peteryoungia aggregata LMG 23059]
MLDFLWLFVVMMGPALLAGAIAYAVIGQRRLSGEYRDYRDAATRQLYRKNEAAGAAEGAGCYHGSRKLPLLGS